LDEAEKKREEIQRQKEAKKLEIKQVKIANKTTKSAAISPKNVTLGEVYFYSGGSSACPPPPKIFFQIFFFCSEITWKLLEVSGVLGNDYGRDRTVFDHIIGTFYSIENKTLIMALAI
jgi:hypothetical protein